MSGKKMIFGIFVMFCFSLLAVGIWSKVFIIGIPKAVGSKEFNVRYQELHVEYEDINLYGQALIPIGTQNESFPTVIYAHGAESDYKADMTTLESLAKSGIACYTFDFYGWTKRSTGPKGVHWFKNVARGVDKSYEEKVLLQVEDLNAVIDHIKTLDFVDEQNVFLLGSSMGGATVAAASSKHSEDIRGIILQYPAINLVPTAKVVGDKYDVNRYSRKVLLLQGTDDSIVPKEMSDELVDYYNRIEKKHATYIVYSNQPHVFTGSYKVQAAKDIYTFIQKNSFK